jgi:small-conductance mechanosensitive channel
MSNELTLAWQQLQAYISTPIFLWQLLVILLAVILAWSINGLLRSYVITHALENWKVGIGAINRVLFPLTSLVFVYIGEFVLSHWQQTIVLGFAAKLLLAMAIIRLAVYALRYIFAPSGWVRTMENAISTTVWILLVFHLSGLLPEIEAALEGVKFGVGKHPITLLLVIQAVFTVLLTLVIALWVSRLLENRLMRAEHIGINMRVVLSKLLRILLSLVAILLALSAVGFDITLLSVFGGALGVGIGLGLQKIASNYVSGFILLTDKSMQIGDLITIDNHYGMVSELRSRYMVLRKLDGTQVVVPNEILITNAVINHSHIAHRSRVQMPLQVSYDSPLEAAMQLMQEAANRQPRVLKDPAADVQVKGFGENGIDLCLTVWIPDPEEGAGGLQSAIYLDIWREFQKHSISIPYPQREIRILGDSSPAKPDQ